MNPVIHDAELGEGTHKIAARSRPSPKVMVLPDPPLKMKPAPVPSGAPEVSPAQEQQAWMAQARIELAASREREEKAGYAAGYEKGFSEAQRGLANVLNQLQGLLNGARKAFGEQIAGVEDIAVSIGFEAAAKLLGDAMVSREGVRAVVVQALARSRDTEKLQVHVSPRDFHLLLEHGGERPVFDDRNVELVPDEHIQLGGCLIETGFGTLDGRLETQLEALRHVLLDLRQRQG